MEDNTLPYVVLPAGRGRKLTTMVKSRGLKTQAQVYAEARRRLGDTPPTVENVTHTVNEVIIDWTGAGWRIAALGDGLIAYQCGCGGRRVLSEDAPPTFDNLAVKLRGRYGPAGLARAKANFRAEKMGEQGLVIPIIAQVYDSATKTPNHYVASLSLTILMSNRHFFFDPRLPGHVVTFQKEDGTEVEALGYPFVKGTTIVCTVPPGLTGPLLMSISAEVNGFLRRATYPIPLN